MTDKKNKAKISENWWAQILLPTLQTVVFLSAFWGVLTLGPRVLNMDGDLGRHITVGKYILTHWTIPTRDVFSFTMNGQPLVPHEWLADVIFALAHEWMGLNGVILFCAFLIALAMLICFRLTLRRSHSVFWTLVFSLLALAASSIHWLSRPHLFTLVLVIVWADILYRMEEGEDKKWWLLPLVMLLWVNTHGAYIAGFVLLGLRIGGNLLDAALAGQKPELHLLRLQGLTLGTSLIVTGINPVGFRIWETSIGYLQNSYLVGHTAEYLSPDFHQLYAAPFLIMVLCSIALLQRPGRRVQGGDILVVCAWTGMGMISMRNIPLYALLAAPVLAQSASEWMNSIPWMKRFAKNDLLMTQIELKGKGWIWAITGVLIAGILLQTGTPLDLSRRGNIFLPDVFPIQAVDYLEMHPIHGNGFNYFPWGGYLLYREYPDRQVFIDGQTDFYGEALTRQYEQVITASDGWQNVLDQYRVSWVMIPPNSDLVLVIEREINWTKVYQDSTAVIYAR